jgi:4-hydroxy-2-oxoglutarate aldolase
MLRRAPGKVAQVLANRPEWQVFVGSGGALLPFLSLGGVGAVAALANIAAAPLRQLLDLYKRGELGAAGVLQLRLAPLNSAITAQFGVSGLKYAMDQVGLYGGPVRRPLLPLSEKAMNQIDHFLLESGLGAEK